MSELIMTDVERFVRDRGAKFGNEPITATELYEGFWTWCEDTGREALALPTFGRKLGELGAQKANIDGRIHFVGVATLAASLGRA